MKEDFKIQGFYDIEAVDIRTGRTVKRWHLKNQLTSVSRTVRNNLLLGTYASGAEGLKIRYFAFGTDSSDATESQYKLGAEQFRKPLTQMYENNGNVVSVVSLQNTEANFRIREIGVFCGLTADQTPDTGVMLSRIVVDIDKNANIVLNIVRTDTTTLG